MNKNLQDPILTDVLKHLKNKGIKNKKSIPEISAYINNITRWSPIKDKYATICRYHDIYIKPKKYYYCNKMDAEWAKEFYNSWFWKKIRYEALRKAEGKCCLCGRSAKDGVRLVVDHIKPLREYPSLALDINNLQVLCFDCNKGKSNSDYTKWN